MISTLPNTVRTPSYYDRFRSVHPFETTLVPGAQQKTGSEIRKPVAPLTPRERGAHITARASSPLLDIILFADFSWPGNYSKRSMKTCLSPLQRTLCPTMLTASETGLFMCLTRWRTEGEYSYTLLFLYKPKQSFCQPSKLIASMAQHFDNKRCG
jgi:hypothetical protein